MVSEKINKKVKALFMFSILALFVAGFAQNAYAKDNFNLLPYKPGTKKVAEKGMRPKPKRTYWLSESNISDHAEGYLVRADGEVTKLDVATEEGISSITFNIPMGDSPAHGANSVYLFDNQVQNRTLVTRTAKWVTLQHSCGWGHGYKYDEQRGTASSLDKVPLELVCNGIWNENFHSSLRAGDYLECRVDSYGKPVEGAKVKLVTAKGWTKEEVSDKHGIVTIGLIKDYYPKGWENFKTRKITPISLSVEYENNLEGEYSGEKYDREKFTTTLSLGYTPSRRDYNSYSHGLLIGLLFTVGPAWIVYRYREKRKRPLKGILYDEKD